MPTSSKSESGRVKIIAPTRHVVCAVDSQMVYGLSVLLFSLKDNSTEDFTVTVGYLGERLAESDRQFIRELSENFRIKLSFLPLPERDIFITQGHISPTTFAKFLIGDHYETPHVWIDSDTIALPGWDRIFDEVASCSPAEGLVVAERGGLSTTEINRPSALPFNAGILGWPRGGRRDWETPLATLEKVDTQEQFLFNQLYAQTAKRISEKFNLLTYRVDSLDPTDLPFIVHYAGAHKPWHLRRDLSEACLGHRCPWSVWFEAERKLLVQLAGGPLEKGLLERHRAGLRTGKIRYQRDHSGYNFLRFLTAMGPGARVITSVTRLLKQWVPRGTHPIH
jgi:hypothetical protein